MGGVTGPNYDNVRYSGPDGIRFPLEAQHATFEVFKEIDINFGGSASTVALTADQAMASYLRGTNAGTVGTASVLFPCCQPGNSIFVHNSSGAAMAVLVTGQTGVVVANNKRAALMMDNIAGDIVRMAPDT